MEEKTYFLRALDELGAPADTLEEGPGTGAESLENRAQDSDGGTDPALLVFIVLVFVFILDGLLEVVEFNLVSVGIESLDCYLRSLA